MQFLLPPVSQKDYTRVNANTNFHSLTFGIIQVNWNLCCRLDHAYRKASDSNGVILLICDFTSVLLVVTFEERKINLLTIKKLFHIIPSTKLVTAM